MVCINAKNMFIQLITPRTELLFEKPIIILCSIVLGILLKNMNHFSSLMNHKSNRRKFGNWINMISF